MDARTDVRTYGQPERSIYPAGRGRGGIKSDPYQIFSSMQVILSA